MKKIFLFLAVCFLMSCQTNKQNALELFNGYSLHLSDDEELQESSKTEAGYYFNYIKDKGVQVPLFRHIEHPEYSIFIGIPYNTSIQRLSQAYISDRAELIESISDSSSFYSYYYVDSLNYITEYACKIGENILFMLAITSHESGCNSKINCEDLRKRIVQKK